MAETFIEKAMMVSEIGDKLLSKEWEVWSTADGIKAAILEAMFNDYKANYTKEVIMHSEGFPTFTFTVL